MQVNSPQFGMAARKAGKTLSLHEQCGHEGADARYRVQEEVDFLKDGIKGRYPDRLVDDVLIQRNKDYSSDPEFERYVVDGPEAQAIQVLKESQAAEEKALGIKHAYEPDDVREKQTLGTYHAAFENVRAKYNDWTAQVVDNWELKGKRDKDLAEANRKLQAEEKED
jgi:hypothetical protein